MDKSKRNLLIAIAGSLLIVIFGVLKIVDIREDHKANMEIIEACMDEGKTVVFEEKHLFRLAEVSCE